MAKTPNDPGKAGIRPELRVLQGGSNQNQIELTRYGFIVFWRGKVVYENGRTKKFKSREDARAFLSHCDAAGKIIH